MYKGNLLTLYVNEKSNICIIPDPPSTLSYLFSAPRPPHSRASKQLARGRSDWRSDAQPINERQRQGGDRGRLEVEHSMAMLLLWQKCINAGFDFTYCSHNNAVLGVR